MQINQLIQEAKAKNFGIGVCAKVVTTQNQILLLQRAARDSCAGVWEMPGGGVEKGEDIVEALKRELQEETGITLESEANYIGYFDFHNIETGKHRRKFCFLIQVNQKITLSGDHSAYKFFSEEE